VLPGIGPALTVAMLLPLTAKVDPASALILFSGIYYGAMFGGSTTSILMNTPGESATMVTAMEGNTMAKNGRAGPALATAAIGSFVAGTIATVLLSFVAPAAAQFALRFGPAEYFMIMVLAFTTVSAVLGSSVAARHDQSVPGTGRSAWSASTRARARRAMRWASPNSMTASTSWSWRSACSRSERRSITCST
jgi:TctA family transporter